MKNQKMKLPLRIFLWIAGIFLLSACTDKAARKLEGPFLFESDQFKSYWYAGKAELNVYALSQARYGENHSGKAVLIFVTEDFSKTKQVKLDYPDKAVEDKVSVLKLNYTKDFITGIYPYSMMLSAFTPVQMDQYPNTLKVSMSTQEWCGHVYAQLNLKGRQYDGQSFSYFEQEGDQKFSLPAVLLEDEIFNLIRLDPQKLPMGEHFLIPGLFFSRIRHEGLKPLKVNTTLTSEEEYIVYSIQYLLDGRNINIRFDKNFPHQIVSWTERYTDNYGRIQETTARLEKQMYTDYWTKNKNAFLHLRDSLGLSSNY